nr:MAG: epoxide hydrolase [Mycolicibacterium hassiacum]
MIARDNFLANIPLYLVPVHPASSARVNWEGFRAHYLASTPLPVPTAYSVFPHPDPQLRYYRQLDAGGHFPALECPDVFVAEVRAGLRALR